MKKLILFLILIQCLAFSKAQNYYEPKLSFGVDLGIPARAKNPAFGRVMEGLFNGGVTMQYNIFGGLTCGAGFKYSFFTLNPFSLNNVQWGASMHFPAGYLKLGYERFTTDRVSFNFSVRAGYAGIFSIHSNDSCSATTKDAVEFSSFIEPQFEIVLLTDKVSSDGFSMVLSYPFYFNEFGPRYFCMDKFPGYAAEEFEGITRFFSFGFGYRYYFGRK